MSGGINAVLTRVAKLEAVRLRPLSPFERACGSFGAFEDRAQAEVAEGKLDRIDMQSVVTALRRCHNDRVRDSWQPQRNGVWEHP